jgi:autotransporter-associated beta strand protein
VAAGITKNGEGDMYLAGTNTYNGSTVINDGSIRALADRALGTTVTPFGFPAGTTVNSNGVLFLNNVQVTNENLTINATYLFPFQTSGDSVWTGDILLNSDIYLTTGSSLLLSGQISGPGGLTTYSGGDLTFGGTNANTYTGTTWVYDGTLYLDKDPTTASNGAMGGPLIIGRDLLPEDNDWVVISNPSQLPDNIQITINASGLLWMSGYSDTVGDIIFNGGDIEGVLALNPTITPTGNITVNRNTNSQANITVRMNLSNSPIIDVTGHSFSPDLRIDGQLFGAGGFTKNGPGEVSLTASNTFTGAVIVNDGLLVVDDSFALGSTVGRTVVNTGAVLLLRFDSHIPLEPLFLNGNGQSPLGALSSAFGSNSWAGNIVLNGDTTLYVNTGDYLNLSGSISDVTAADITKIGTGTLIYSGGSANTYDETFVNEGTLELAKTIPNSAIPGDLRIGDGIGGLNADVVRLRVFSQIGNLGLINILGSGLFDLNDIFETTGPINGLGRIDLGSGTLNVTNDNNCCDVFSGLIFGSGDLIKSGDGVWTITGNNLYTGTTTIDDDGALVIDGVQPQSHVTITDDARLGGQGIVGNVNCLGAVAPGQYTPIDPAILTCSNTFFGAATFFFVDINGSTPGTGYDQLNVRGTNQLGGASLQLSIGPDFAPVEGERLTILNNDGADAIQGTFAGLPNGSVLSAGPYQFRVLYSEPFLNDVVLLVTNTAAKLATNPIVETGNGNGEIDPGECNLLRIPLMNRLGVVVSGVSATLSTTNPAVTVTHPTSPYPNLPPNGTRTNILPFQITTSPSLGCGTNINFILTVRTATNGTFTIPIQMFTGASGSVMRFNRTGDQAIPDLSVLNSTIVVSGITSPVHHVEISLHLSHTTDDNLDISIEDPDGTGVLLSSDNGGTLDDYGTSCADADRTLFADRALLPITAATAPFRGLFQPEQPLSVYRGKFGSDVNGTWTLSIGDDTAGGLGTLHCWSIMIYPTACPPGGGQCERCPGLIVGSITNSDAVQSNRLTRVSVNGVDCENPKPCPGDLFPPVATIHYDTYTFTNLGPASCVTVSLTSPCNGLGAGADFVNSSAYLGSYDPANKCTNYLGDIGASPNPTGSYSFTVPSNSVFVVVVNETTAGGGCTNYVLDVSGYQCPQQLDIAHDPSSTNRVLLKWSTSGAGYNLVSTNVLGDPAGFAPIGPPPVVVNGKFTVTNTASGSTRFYELRRP